MSATPLLPRSYSVIRDLHKLARSPRRYCRLTPACLRRYVATRVNPLVAYYKRRSVEAQSALARFQIFIYCMGGLGTMLSARRLDILVAITTALSSSLNTLIEKEQARERLGSARPSDRAPLVRFSLVYSAGSGCSIPEPLIWTLSLDAGNLDRHDDSMGRRCMCTIVPRRIF